jgi:hypothetical protein
MTNTTEQMIFKTVGDNAPLNEAFTLTIESNDEGKITGKIVFDKIISHLNEVVNPNIFHIDDHELQCVSYYDNIIMDYTDDILPDFEENVFVVVIN